MQPRWKCLVFGIISLNEIRDPHFRIGLAVRVFTVGKTSFINFSRLGFSGRRFYWLTPTIPKVKNFTYVYNIAAHPTYPHSHLSSYNIWWWAHKGRCHTDTRMVYIWTWSNHQRSSWPSGGGREEWWEDEGGRWEPWLTWKYLRKDFNFL